MVLEKGDLAGLRHAGKGPQRLELLDMGLGELVAAGGELLNGNEGLALALLHRSLSRRFTQSVNGNEGQQQTVFRDLEPGGVGAVDVDGVEVEPRR